MGRFNTPGFYEWLRGLPTGTHVMPENLPLCDQMELQIAIPFDLPLTPLRAEAPKFAKVWMRRFRRRYYVVRGKRGYVWEVVS